MEDEEMSMEDAYTMDEEDSEEHGMDQNDPSDKLGLDTMDFGDEEGEEDHESEEDQAIYDIKNAIQELEAAFAELEKAQGAEHADMDSEFGDEEGEEDTDEEMMGMPMENRRMTREYVEKVQDGSYENSKQKSVKNAGANSGESMPLPGESKSMKWGDGKPTSNANASNIVGKTSEKTDGQHNVGTSPNKVNKGIAQEKSEQFTGTEWEKNSKAGANAGKTAFKTKVPAHGLAGNTRNNGSEGTGVGAKTGGQEAGQTGGNTNTRSIETGQRK